MAEEKKIEQKLVDAVKAKGGVCLKFISSTDGYPDRIVIFKNKIAFVEVKAPGKKPRKLQLKRHELLRKYGFKVYVLDEAKEIGGIIDEILTT